MALLINEMFTSFQGEGSYIGRPVTFIRFAGCNLNCPFCDETHLDTNIKLSNKDEISDFVTYTLSEVIFRNSKIVLTGGEPLIQNKQLFKSFLATLYVNNFKIHLETNGTKDIPIEYAAMFEHIVTSPKAPEYRLPNSYNEIKLVIGKKGIQTNTNLISKFSRLRIKSPIWLQPESNKDSSMKAVIELYKYCQEFYPELDVRVGIQLHKIYKAK